VLLGKPVDSLSGDPRYLGDFVPALQEDPQMNFTYPRESTETFGSPLYPDYKSTLKRAPEKPLIMMPHTLSELTGPVYGHEIVREHDSDLTAQHAGAPIGERIIVHGHVLDEDGRGVANTLVELWQTNAKGHYRFITIKPGGYPWDNHHNAWRPAHIHFSVFGHSFLSRLVTQMYFPNDPLFPFDPIFNSVTDEKARMRLVSHLDLENSSPYEALCYRFDIVLRGHNATPMET
jgi:protocatechuate 3,4-dioxygenase, beta subunit